MAYVLQGQADGALTTGVQVTKNSICVLFCMLLLRVDPLQVLSTTRDLAFAATISYRVNLRLTADFCS